MAALIRPLRRSLQMEYPRKSIQVVPRETQQARQAEVELQAMAVVHPVEVVVFLVAVFPEVAFLVVVLAVETRTRTTTLKPLSINRRHQHLRHHRRSPR